MKRKLLVLGVLGLVPFITACGGSKENKMECVVHEDGFVTGYDLYFDSDDKLDKTVTKLGVDYSYGDLSQYGCDTPEQCVEQADETLDPAWNSNDHYEECKVEKGKTIVYLSCTLADKGYENEDHLKKGMTKEEVKKVLEDNRLTCN